MIAGDASGDLAAGLLAAALLRRRPDLRLEGIGGARMARAGVRILADSSRWSAIGFLQAARLVPTLLPKLHWARRELAANPPDALVLIDFGAFNTRVARAARKAGLSTLYYLPPGSWSRRPRSRDLGSFVDVIATQFPWSVGHYLGGARVLCVGHPIADLCATVPGHAQNNADNEHYTHSLVALLPGSRQAETKTLAPILAASASLLRQQLPSAEFALLLAPGLEPDTVLDPFRRRAIPVSLLPGEDLSPLRQAAAAIVASGTATLQLACLGVPMVVVYLAPSVTYLQYKVLRGLLRGQRRIGLPNLLLGRDVVPEYLQRRCRPQLIAREVINLLRDPDRRRRMKADLAQVAEKLGPPGASEKTAQLVLDLIEARRKALAPSAPN
jgi:lipid-A-disaccharide synthase